MKYLIPFNESRLTDEAEAWTDTFLQFDKEYRLTRDMDLKRNYYAKSNASFRQTKEEIKDCFINMLDDKRIHFVDHSEVIWRGSKMIYDVNFTFFLNTKDYTQGEIEELASDYRTSVTRLKELYDIDTFTEFQIMRANRQHFVKWEKSKDFDWDDVKYLQDALRDKVGRDVVFKIIVYLK